MLENIVTVLCALRDHVKSQGLEKPVINEYLYSDKEYCKNINEVYVACLDAAVEIIRECSSRGI